uniref:Uncharacterized protein n=1 Tax=Anguilla anguilla TaxID=7936 RepID=A0A0E9XCF1_ANGAN
MSLPNSTDTQSQNVPETSIGFQQKNVFLFRGRGHSAFLLSDVWSVLYL